MGTLIIRKSVEKAFAQYGSCLPGGIQGSWERGDGGGEGVDF